MVALLIGGLVLRFTIQTSSVRLLLTDDGYLERRGFFMGDAADPA
jgi:hypothetical protein